MGKLKRVLITGASGGIGRALTKRFQGYDLLIPTHKELDLSSVDSINGYMKDKKFGVDILINNAAENMVCPIRSFMLRHLVQFCGDIWDSCGNSFRPNQSTI